MQKIINFLKEQLNKMKWFINNNKAPVIKFFKERYILISIITIVLICSIAIALGVYSQVTKKRIVNTKTDEEIYSQLKNKLNSSFNNELNDYLSLAYDIEKTKERKL